MRILVLEEENGTARVRESREVFDVTELRLSYACSGRQTQFVFSPDMTNSAKNWQARACLGCGKELVLMNPNALASDTVLGEALDLYRSFYDFVTKKHPLPELKMLLIRPGADGNKTPSAASGGSIGPME